MISVIIFLSPYPLHSIEYLCRITPARKNLIARGSGFHSDVALVIVFALQPVLFQWLSSQFAVAQFP